MDDSVVRGIALFIQCGAENGDQEMGKVGGVFIHLQPADDAMVAKILCNACFGYAQVFGKARTYGFAFSACTAAQQVRDGNAEGLAGLDVIVGRKVGVREDEHAGTGRGFVGLL